MARLVLVFLVCLLACVLSHNYRDDYPSQIDFCVSNHNDTLAIIKNEKDFNTAVTICTEELKYDCWIGLQRVGCDEAFNETTQKYNEESHYWEWIDGTEYNETIMKSMWCTSFPKKFPRWYPDMTIGQSKYSQESLCSSRYAYIDKRQKCLKNAQDGHDDRWGFNRDEYHKGALCSTNDNVFYSSQPKSENEQRLEMIIFVGAFGFGLLFVIVITFGICLGCKLYYKNGTHTHTYHIYNSNSGQWSESRNVSKIAIDSMSPFDNQDESSIDITAFSQIGSETQDIELGFKTQ